MYIWCWKKENTYLYICVCVSHTHTQNNMNQLQSFWSLFCIAMVTVSVCEINRPVTVIGYLVLGTRSCNMKWSYSTRHAVHICLVWKQNCMQLKHNVFKLPNWYYSDISLIGVLMLCSRFICWHWCCRGICYLHLEGWWNCIQEDAQVIRERKWVG
jgi:hypothetical protein